MTDAEQIVKLRYALMHAEDQRIRLIRTAESLQKELHGARQTIENLRREREVGHGMNGYYHGCRCAVCKLASKAKSLEYREKYKAERAAGLRA